MTTEITEDSLEKTANKEAKKSAKKEGKKTTLSFVEDDFYFTKTDQCPDTGEIISKKVLKKEFSNHLMKCQIRTARAFNVPIEQVTEAANVLNGRKVHGYQVTDLIGRHGFFNGEQISRTDLAAKHGKFPETVEIATKKLSEIIRNKDVEKSYRQYIEAEAKPLADAEFNKEIKEGV